MRQLHYVVTGCSGGIGAAITSRLRAQGHRVTGFDIQRPAEPIDGFVALDLEDPAQIASAAASVEGPFDGLCNNAGVPPRDGWAQKILQINFLSQRLFTRAMLSKLSDGASIVNMASRAGQNWRDGVDQIKRLAGLESGTSLQRFIDQENIDPTRAYDLSKEAMIVWTIAETEAFKARGIRINSLSPAAVSTQILEDFARAFGDRMTKNVARAGRPGEVDEIADVAAFLLSPDSRWLYGIDIWADGGMAAFATSDALALNKMSVL